jgi:ABC-type molybdate transport system substrate-binding protein
VAVIKAHDTKDAAAFLAFLATPDAKAVFAHYGFTAP